MGFKDTEWAYALDLPPTMKAVLLALAHRADDRTHSCFPGQATLARMAGITTRSVSTAVKELEQLGAIRREPRRAGGYKTSDLYVLNVNSYVNEVQVNEVQVNEVQVNEVPISPEAPSDLTGTTFVYIEEGQSVDQPEDKPDLYPSTDSAFDEAYGHWPKKVERKKSLQAFTRAAKTRPVAELVADTVRFGDAYAATTERQYVPSLAAWLNGERWTDQPPTPPVPSQAQWDALLGGDEKGVHTVYTLGGRRFGSRPTRDKENLAVVARLAARESGHVADDCAAGEHRWLPNGSCMHCPALLDDRGL